MMTVNDVSKMTGVSIRTLHYYDEIGLLKPAKYTDSDYRLYDDAALEKLQQILLFRELEFPLKDIKEIVNRSDFTKLFEVIWRIKLPDGFFSFIKTDIVEDKYFEKRANFGLESDNMSLGANR